MLIIIYQGTTASDMHYQAYLLEGIARWNSDRGRAMVDGESYRQLNITTPLYPTKLVNRLSNMVYGEAFDGDYRDPCKYTG